MAGVSVAENEDYRRGSGNWHAFTTPVESVLAAAESWRSSLSGVTKPWLCWNVDSDWCLVQQRLVSAVGWTPVVGGDPRVPKPPLLPHAVYVDFNAMFGFPTMWMHFPLEFAFAFSDRLAFWHSDLLIRSHKMRQLAELFENLEDGTVAAAKARLGITGLLSRKGRRFWELVGCTTKAASRSQFDNGCGWWMNFALHPNCPSESERERRRHWYWDHGAGILYWQKYCRGKVVTIKEEEVAEGHCTQIGAKSYKRVSPNNAQRFLAKDLARNFELKEVCERLGLEHLLRE